MCLGHRRPDTSSLANPEASSAAKSLAAFEAAPIGPEKKHGRVTAYTKILRILEPRVRHVTSKQGDQSLVKWDDISK